MTLNYDSLKELLCERLCEEVRIEQRPDGSWMVGTHFQFPDGDHYPIHISDVTPGGVRLSDHGHTLMHISYDHDIDLFMDGTRGLLLERIMNESDLKWSGGAFCLDSSIEKLPEAIFNFGQALTRVYDLTLLSRSNVGSTFYDDLEQMIVNLIDEDKITKSYPPDVPNADAYTVDYRIEGKNNVPLFLYGVPNRDKARLTTIILSHFHRNNLSFESILVFEDQAEIPRLDLARLSDVGGEMISSLDSVDDFRRKVVQRVAAEKTSPIHA